MSIRATVALVGAVVLGVSLLAGNYAVSAVTVACYVAWMFVRDWINRRDKYTGWGRLK
jgi:hypothetical protein